MISSQYGTSTSIAYFSASTHFSNNVLRAFRVSWCSCSGVRLAYLLIIRRDFCCNATEALLALASLVMMAPFVEFPPQNPVGRSALVTEISCLEDSSSAPDHQFVLLLAAMGHASLPAVRRAFGA